ncbi:MAG: S8 family serine peptidase, partial [Anaerolineae bacterium]|nr:S8 family serine peptidase [Anaerolineae bacterium]
MNTKWSTRVWTILFLIGFVAGTIQPVAAIAAPAAAESAAPLTQVDALDKIEPLVLEQIAAAGQAEFFVWIAEKADLSQAQQLNRKVEKGQFVFEALRATAERSQRALLAVLDAQGVRYRPFYIANKIFVYAGDQALAIALAARSDVAKITPNHQYQLQEPIIEREPAGQILAIEPNITFIQADDVWALGITGHGTVMAGNDTGLDWDHPAIINQYRGWNGASADHNYNWWDATGTYPTVPGDGHGHGTHTTGTMVGDDGGANQIGVAPGAQTIHCKNMTDGGSGDDYTFSECFEWDLAPWDLSGANPRPDLAPHAINNSWGYWGGGADQFEDEIDALQAAGIVVEVSAGNEGPTCSTLRSPSDYEQVLTTGSISHASGTLPGTISDFSSRGPSSLDPLDYMPDVMAPGENIRSSVPGGGYEGGWSGTSMAGPHVTALIGLMWSANPALQGMVAETYDLIYQTTVPLTGQGGSGCGGDYVDGPNNDWGFGTIDALAAVQAALLFGNPGTLQGTVTDSSSGLPIPAAHVTAVHSEGYTFSTLTDDSGFYSRVVMEGIYEVTASKYGYLPETVSGVAVVEDMITTQNFALDPAPSYTVSGTVTDANTGWPLYASIAVEGAPIAPVWTDPVTGAYSVTLVAGMEYSFTANAWAPGYMTGVQPVGLLMGDAIVDIALDVDIGACNAPGYTQEVTQFYLENFESGYGGWSMDGLWNPENQGDTCGSYIAPFPSPFNAAYYGDDTTCNYDVGYTAGSLSMSSPVTVPSDQAIFLSFESYEQTECSGNCYFDKRYIEFSDDGGLTWTTIIEGYMEYAWNNYWLLISGFDGNDLTFRFRFDSGDDFANAYYGWMVDDVALYGATCTPAEGSLVVGNVYDDLTDLGLNEAMVAVDGGDSVSTYATPDDPAVDDGFYTVFAPAGWQ